MNRRITILSIGVVAALAMVLSIGLYNRVSAAPGDQGGRPMMHRMQGMKGGMCGPGMQGRRGGMMGLAADLHLTADQQQKLQAIRKSFREETQPVRAQIKNTRTELVKLLSADRPDRARIKDTAQKLSDLQGRITEAGIDRLLQAREVLTPQQRKVVQGKLAEMQLNGRGAGMGMMMGACPMMGGPGMGMKGSCPPMMGRPGMKGMHAGRMGGPRPY